MSERTEYSIHDLILWEQKSHEAQSIIEYIIEAASKNNALMGKELTTLKKVELGLSHIGNMFGCRREIWEHNPPHEKFKKFETEAEGPFDD